MTLTHKEVREILAIVDAAEHLADLELAIGGLRLRVSRHGSQGAAVRPAPAAAVAVAPAAPVAGPVAAAPPSSRPPAEEPVPAGIVAIRAPMLGTFYRAPAPNAKPFVEVGQKVRAGDTVCIIEVMKLFNSIPAGVDGTVVKVCAENAAMVEFNQQLVHIRPDA